MIDADASKRTPFVEHRVYTLKPEGQREYLRLCAETAALRRAVLPGLLGFFTVETGGDLCQVHHFYAYPGGFDERDQVRAAAAATPEWKKFVEASRVHVPRQESRTMNEATMVYDAVRGMEGYRAQKFVASEGAPSPVYELREYQLHLGYDTVPKWMTHYKAGLPSKLEADAVSGQQLALVAYTDVGQLNTVIELWRYPSCQAHMTARQAARGVAPWRDAIAAIQPLAQTFRSTLLRPHPVSNYP